MAKKKGKGTEETLEKQLWKSADKLRKNIDAAEYKHIVLGLIFLNSDAFEELYDKLKAGEGSLSHYNKEVLKRIDDIEQLDEETKNKLFFLIDNVIQNFKTKKAFS